MSLFSMPTAKFHVTNILVKLGVGSRTEAALFALKHRLVGAVPQAISA